MGNRARDRVIYIRTDDKLQAEFEKQKEASGYGSNADFVDYLLRIMSAPMIKCKKTPKKKCRFMAERRKKR